MSVGSSVFVGSGVPVGSGFSVGSSLGAFVELSPPLFFDVLGVDVGFTVNVGDEPGVSGGTTGIISSGTSIYCNTTSSILTASALVISLEGLNIPSG